VIPSGTFLFLFFLSLLQAIEVKAGHSFLVEHKGCCIFDFFLQKPL
jgi:hypothetical protein